MLSNVEHIIKTTLQLEIKNRELYGVLLFFSLFQTQPQEQDFRPTVSETFQLDRMLVFLFDI